MLENNAANQGLRRPQIVGRCRALRWQFRRCKVYNPVRASNNLAWFSYTGYHHLTDFSRQPVHGSTACLLLEYRSSHFRNHNDGRNIRPK